MSISLSTTDVIILSQNNNNTQEEQNNVHPSYELQQVGKTFYGGFQSFVKESCFQAVMKNSFDTFASFLFVL